MTSEEIKRAMREFKPVQCGGMSYRKINAYTYRIIETHTGYKEIMQVELQSFGGRSVTIAEADKVELLEKE